MLKKVAYSICVIIFLFCFLGCPETVKEGEWFDFVIIGISYSAYINLGESYRYKSNVVYTGNDAKKIFNFTSFHIDKDVGGLLEEKKTYMEIINILETFGLPTDLVKKAIGSFTALYYISDAGHECAVFVEDTSSVHSRSVMSTGL
ncbi:MAG: hypothetical protein FWB86_12670 [Treponema sp.]|nr:hypothetical protein [Treponema sp.]MCL2251784.1 hypothetical protein [Treponema sp.]